MARPTAPPPAATQGLDAALSESALDTFERAAVTMMRRLAGRHTLSDIARRSGHDLPPVSWALLEHLDASGPMRVSDIAACHGVDISSVTPRLQALERAGLIERGTDPLDARVSIISLSRRGRGAVHRIAAARRELLARALEDADPETVRAAAKLMLAVADELAD